MVRSAAALIARDGLRATGLREVAAHAQAPRGSIQHYFPGGKDQLTLEALTWMGALVRGELEKAASVPGDSNPASASAPTHDTSTQAQAVLATFVDMWRRSLAETDIAAGCSIAAVVHDTGDPNLLARTQHVFASWRQPIRRALLDDGVEAGTAEHLATAVLAALEGAVILCRAQRDLTPLEQTGAVLHDLLERPKGPSRSRR